MGEIIAKTMRGMNWKAKISLMLIFTIIFSALVHEGWFRPKTVQAAISTVTTWTALGSTYHSATKTPTVNVSIGGTASSKRLLVVAISYKGTSATATCTVSYGGTQMTLANGDPSGTSSTAHTWLFYMLENNTLMNGTSRALSATVTGGGTVGMTDGYYAVFSGVDQSMPINDSKNVANVSGTTVAFSSGLTVLNGAQGVVTYSIVRTGSTTAPSITTWPTNWTQTATQTNTTSPAHRSVVGLRSIPSSDQSPNTMSTTVNNTSDITSMTAMSIQAATPPTLTWTTAASIGSTSAILGSNITAQGSSPITQLGTCWNTTSSWSSYNCSVAWSSTSGWGTSGAFSHLRSPLPQATQIYYGGYADNSGAGRGWSNTGSLWTEPSTQASNVSWTSVTPYGMITNWTRGSGGNTGGAIVIMKQGSAVTSVPADGTYSTYNANSNFTSGYQIGTGEYVVYKGTGTNVSVTGLSPSTTYYVAIFEYAGQADTSGLNLGTSYNSSSPAAGSQSTTAAALVPTVVSGPTISVSSPYSLYGSFVPGSFHVNSVFNDNGYAITGCEYTINGSTWTAGTKSGSGASTNCDADVSTTDGPLTIQMRATNPGGTTATSSDSKTCDSSAPTGLSTASPANEATNVSVNPTLQAGTASDSGTGIVYYYFQIATDTGFTQNVQSSGWQSAASWYPSTLLHSQQYFWRVAAQDAVGNSTGFTTSIFFSTLADCVRNDPSVTLLTSGGDTTATISSDGGTALYVLTVKNNDFGDCGNTTFSLSVSDTNSTNFNASTLSDATTGSLAPGATYTGNVTVNGKPGQITGTNKTHVTSASDTYHSAILSQPDVTTTLNVPVWNKNTPYLVIGPDSGNVGIGGYLDYTVTVQNNDTGADATTVTFSLGLSDSNSTAFDPSVFTSTGNQAASLSLNPGQKGSVTLRVTSKSGAALDQVNITIITLSAPAHSSPASVTATTTVGNRLLHNSVNIASAKWASFGGWGVPGGKYGEFNCETCHLLSYTDASGITPNIKKIRQRIVTPDTTWGAIPGDNGWITIYYDRPVGNSLQGVMGYDSWDSVNNLAASPRTSSTKICEYCHTYDAGSSNGVAAHPFNSAGNALPNHQGADGTDCTGCHKHSRGFSPGACDSCHGAPPGYGADEATFASAYPNYASSHNTHYNPQAGGLPTEYVAYSIRSQAGAYVFDCGRCHSTSAADHRANTDGIVDVKLLGMGTFTRGSSGASHVRGSYTFYDNDSSCAGTYCHGSFTGGNAYTAVWGSSATAVCGTCHGTSQASPPAGGSHSKHVAGSAMSALNCDMCHNGIAAWGTVQDKSRHVNLATDWSLKTADSRISASGLYKNAASGSNASVGSGYGSCSGIYCHSSVQQDGGGPLASYNGTPVWGSSGSVTCSTASCHGGNSDPNKMATGSHTKHVGTSSYNYGCPQCHMNAGSGTTEHADGNIDIWISLGGSYSQGASHAPGTGYGSCSSVYCHSNGTATPTYTTPTWGSSGSGACGTCHGVNGTNTPSSTPHGKHVASSSGYQFACSKCHVAVITSTANSTQVPGIFSYNLHANGVRDVAFDSYNTFGSYSASNCQQLYCHSNGTSVATGATPWSSAAWSGSLGCSGCHGSSGDTSGRPWYTTYAPKANSHMVGSHMLSCNYCHYSTTSDGASITSVGRHVNKAYDITPWGSYGSWGSISFTYISNASGGQCQNISCHGGGSGVWGSSGSVVCIPCHSINQNGRDAVVAEFGLAWGHKTAKRGPVTSADCVVCHLEGTGGTTYRSALHKDGKIDLRDPKGTGDQQIKDMSGATFSFARFWTSYGPNTRWSTGAQSNNPDNVLTQNFCLACHDSTGATNTTARSGSGTAFMPWGTAGGAPTTGYTTLAGAAVPGGLVNVKDQLALTNSSVHPVRGPIYRDYPWTTKLASPYNNNGGARDNNTNSNLWHSMAYSVVINCFDCHNTNTPKTSRTIVAHGWVSTTRDGIYQSAPNLCTICHDKYSTSPGSSTGHGAGSAINSTNGNSGEQMNSNCHNCHSSGGTAARRPARPVPAQDYHGNSTKADGSLWTPPGRQIYAFIRSWTTPAYHRPFRAVGWFTTGSATCGTGACPANSQVGDGSTRTYSPGGTY